MNENLEKLQAKKIMRGKYLNALYDKTDGNTHARVDMREVAIVTGCEGEDIDAVAIYLKEEGLLEFVALGGIIAITHRGVLEVEQSREAPSQPTQHFPAFNIILGNITNSQILQASPGSHQTGTFNFDNASVEEFVSQLTAKVEELGLAEAQIQELRADLATLEAQRKSSRPKPAIVKEVLSSLRHILESATAKIVAGPLLHTLLALTHSAGF